MGFVNNCKNTIGNNGYERYGYYEPDFDYRTLEPYDMDHYFMYYVRELKECEDSIKLKVIFTIFCIVVMLCVCVCFCFFRKQTHTNFSTSNTKHTMKNSANSEKNNIHVNCTKCNESVTLNRKSSAYRSKFLCKKCLSLSQKE
jgi:hypothetical protein